MGFLDSFFSAVISLNLIPNGWTGGTGSNTNVFDVFEYIADTILLGSYKYLFYIFTLFHHNSVLSAKRYLYILICFVL